MFHSAIYAFTRYKYISTKGKVCSFDSDYHYYPPFFSFSFIYIYVFVFFLILSSWIDRSAPDPKKVYLLKEPAFSAINNNVDECVGYDQN